MNLPNKLETGKEVAFFPPVQNTETPYATLAAMYAAQGSQVKGYLYFVTAIGYYEYLGTVNGTAVDYRSIGDNLTGKGNRRKQFYRRSKNTVRNS
jgi:hypothetical protein